MDPCKRDLILLALYFQTVTGTLWNTECSRPCPDNDVSCQELCLGNCESGCDRDGWQCESCKPGYTGRYCDTCVKGYTGQHCNETCPYYCKDGCDRDTGYCYWSDGEYRGRYCTNLIVTSNCEECDRDSGNCTKCKRGFRGTFCNETCPDNCLTCDRENDSCDICKDGYTGSTCNKQCRPNCVTCKDESDVCTRCLDGYTGPHCNKTCPVYCEWCYSDTGECAQCKRDFWDICNKNCSHLCLNGCKRDTGECYECKDGYYGQFCETECPTSCKICKKDSGACDVGTTGTNSNLTCPFCNTCDHDTGVCYGCKQGFTGPYCNESCPPNCKDGCDRYTGSCDNCTSGYTGRYCTCRLNSDENSRYIAESLTTAVAILLAAVVILFLFLATIKVCRLSFERYGVTFKRESINKDQKGSQKTRFPLGGQTYYRYKSPDEQTPPTLLNEKESFSQYHLATAFLPFKVCRSSAEHAQGVQLSLRSRVDSDCSSRSSGVRVHILQVAEETRMSDPANKTGTVTKSDRNSKDDASSIKHGRQEGGQGQVILYDDEAPRKKYFQIYVKKA